jgi:PAS domain S-box-containing protein
MGQDEPVNILLVDDQPAKLISYEVMLEELGENLIKTASAREALEVLLKNEIAVVLVDVCMPELDGFELAAMIREHPRFQKTAIIFISAIHLADDDRLRGYRMGAVDYMPVPVVPDILRAKVNVFADLYRKTRMLETLNRELEQRVAERTADLQGSNARLVESEAQLRLATEAAEIGLWDVDYVNDKLFWPPRVKAMFGISPDVPVTMADFYAGVHPSDREATEAAFAAACDPERRALYDVEYRTIGKEDGAVRWVAAKGRGVFDPDGHCVRVIGTALDITERKRAEEHHALLAREVDHRAKNALAVVQSIVRLTRAPTTEAYVQAVEGRIAALSHAHTLLSESRWQGASLVSLVEDELAPYGVERHGHVHFEGPDIKLDPAAAQSLNLVLHELATNSAKYGSLSRPTGKLSVTWKRQGTTLALEWVESGGPAVAEPKTTGFGIKVIRASVENQLHGTVQLDWRKEGLHCRLTVPALRDLVRDAPNVTTLERREASAAPEKPATQRRVFLVEDETLVAMMIQDTLRETGVDVVGPYSRVAEAIKAAKAGGFDVAVLDVNLDGEPVYELAELLAARGVPFVFMTGYGRESIDERFADRPVIRKPVDLERLKEALAAAMSLEDTAVPLQA